MKDKPTLDELFQSKKMDLPGEEFWNGFQDRVKGQTMAALSQRSKASKVRKAGVYGFAPVFILAMVSWTMLQPEKQSGGNLSQSSINVATNEASARFDQLASVLDEDLPIMSEGAIQLAKLESFESFAKSSIQLAGVGESFSQRVLHLSPSSNKTARFTF
ncbi:MAG: hypothetical protein VW576_09010 [Opitutae bacterium]